MAIVEEEKQQHQSTNPIETPTKPGISGTQKPLGLLYHIINQIKTPNLKFAIAIKGKEGGGGV